MSTHNRSLREIYDAKIKPAYWLHDLTANASVQLFTEGKLHPRQVVFTPDSKGFYFTSPHSSTPMYDDAAIDLLYYYDLASKSTVLVDLDWPNGVSREWKRRQMGSWPFLRTEPGPAPHATSRAGCRGRASWLDGDHAQDIDGFALSLDGQDLCLWVLDS